MLPVNPDNVESDDDTNESDDTSLPPPDEEEITVQRPQRVHRPPAWAGYELSGSYS